MRRSRLAATGFSTILLAACSATVTPAPAEGSPVRASASPSQLVITNPPTASPSPSPAASAVANGWQRFAGQPALDAIQLSTVTWTGSRFLAAGMADDGSSPILDSTDGQTWHVQPGFGPDVEIHGFATGPAGVVAVGDRGSNAQSWFSTDGLSWAAGPAGSALSPAKGNTVQMSAVVSSGAGWLAVGVEDSACNINCTGSAAVRAAVWRSTDGLTWTRQPPASSLSHAAMFAVVQGGPGFVAVGSAPDRPGGPVGPDHAVVWTSTDGRAWTRVADAPTFHPPGGADQTFGAVMTGVASGAGKVVAVGTVESQDAGAALAWLSTDGLGWTRARSDSFATGQLFHVSAVPGGFVATGPSGPDSCLGGIWSSSDGASWSCVAADPAFTGFAAYATAASPSLEVVVGFDANGSGSMVWTRPLP